MVNITQEEIMKNWNIGNINSPLVSISCITYNQELYISQTLDGFLMQKTNFPFEVLIHDDASTDSTSDIIREYEIKFPKIIKPIIQTENQWSKGLRCISATYNYPRSKGKYIAFCEGDDYWIDENKLQMQVDFLEQNPEYGLCYTRAKKYFQDKERFSKKNSGSYVDSFEDLLINGNRIPTLTVCAKKELIMQYVSEIKPQEKDWLMGDYPMWLYIAYKSKVRFFDKESAVYRVLQNSASHSTDIQKKISFSKNVYEIRKYFSDKYNIQIKTISDEYINFHVYIDLLNESYDKTVSQKLRRVYNSMKNKCLKDKIYNCASYNFVLWKVLQFFILILKKNF